MSDKDKLEMLLSHQVPCIKTLGGRAIKFQSEPPVLEMEFEAIPEFLPLRQPSGARRLCHRNAGCSHGSSFNRFIRVKG